MDLLVACGGAGALEGMRPLSACQSVAGMSPLMFSLQALLLRHETYIADSEREREIMTAQISQLEIDKATLENRNAAVIAENRDLLDQLEAVNNAVAESDAHVSSLQATLASAQQELSRLSQLAARTQRLEQQLADYEREQIEWHTTLTATQESEKSAVRRWQQAERTLADLQEQMERIEREAREDRERHVEIVGRMERRAAVERELGTAAGRLKGAAATATRHAGGTNVVSHFVKDILQDNANLQMGIVELREMLQNSNQEVENLRRQMEDHQPTSLTGQEDGARSETPKDLRQELQRAQSSGLHVHHHYHAPSPATASRTNTLRRPKKKRYSVLTPGHFTPPSGSVPGILRGSMYSTTPSSASTILQQTAVSIPQPVPKRLSAQSHMTSHSTVSSSPGSPQSIAHTNRASSIFDRVFSDADISSRPTTPGYEDLGSPIMAPFDVHRTKSTGLVERGKPLLSNHRARPSIDSILGTSLDNALPAVAALDSPEAIPEENEAEWEDTLRADNDSASPISDELLELIHNNATIYKPTLRRAASHESLLSVRGMDIHTLHTRPSQLLAGSIGAGGRSFSNRPALVPATAGVEVSSVHAGRATATLSSTPGGTGRSLLSSMAADQRRLNSKPSMGLGSKVGGWVFGRWGAAPAPTPTPTTNPSKPSAPSRTSTARSDVSSLDPGATPKKPKREPQLQFRAPGINQSGPILGLGPEAKVMHAPVMKTFDAEGMRKALDAEDSP